MAKKVLLVEDNEYTQNIYVKALTSAGYLVAVASNGQECLEHLVLEMPDLILLDLMMPVLDGFDVLHTVKMASATRSVPVLVVSARDEQSDIKRAMDAGAAGYLVKAQTRPRDVVAKVTELLGARVEGGTQTRHYDVLLQPAALDAPKLAGDMKLPDGLRCARCDKSLVFRIAPKVVKNRRYFVGCFTCPTCEAKRMTTVKKIAE